MAELIDLTLTLSSERVSKVPGLTEVETVVLQTPATHARSNQRLCMATHIGARIDALFHFVDDAAIVDDMPREKFMGSAVPLDLRSTARGLTQLQVSELEEAVASAQTLNGNIVVLLTGWSEAKSGGPDFYGHSLYLSNESADYLAKAGGNSVAVGLPIDEHPATPQSTIHGFPVYCPLLGQNIPLIENLINFDQLIGKELELWTVTLKLKAGDVIATRTVACIA